MDANAYKEIFNSLAALILSGAKYIKSKRVAIAYIVVCLVAVLVCLWLASCTTNHYFSINAEEITNPSIEYHDSTSVYNPF